MDGIIIMEVVLLIVSIICFVVSFLIPEKKPEGSGIDQELAKQEVHEMMEKEAEALREPIQNMAAEYTNYAINDALTKLDDVTNEKTFELTSYSDTVMRELKKEEEEVVLLHQAVKEERENLQKTVKEERESLQKTVTAAGKAAKVMRESVEKIRAMRPVEVSYGAGSVKIAPMASKVSEKNEKKQAK